MRDFGTNRMKKCLLQCELLSLKVVNFQNDICSNFSKLNAVLNVGGWGHFLASRIITNERNIVNVDVKLKRRIRGT